MDELPPLPSFDCDDDCFSVNTMQAYARQAVAQAVAAEREACALICDVTPPYPFRPSIEAAHAIRARGKENSNG